jgi:sugar transferase (PEP-CTERM/EpsH1 system associated)
MRVLYLTHRVPFPPDKGDRIRNYHVLRQLVKRGRVWLACLADEPAPAECEAQLRRMCERATIVPVTRGRRLRMAMSLLAGRSISEGAFAERGLRRVIREWAGETNFDAAIVSASSLAPYLKMPQLAGVPKIVDLVDVDSQKWADYAGAARGAKRWLYSLEAARVRKLERELPKWTRAVAMVSRAEADVFESFAGAGTATVAANGVDLEFFRPAGSASDRTTCAFVGAMDYRPNIDAATWFAREIWPRIRQRCPDAEFRIVGRKPAPEVQRLAELPGVTVTGQVPDVRPHLASATVAIAPLRLGRGIQNKVLEAMAMGKAIVASPAALAALNTKSGIHLLAATGPEEWTDAVGSLFADPERCRELGRAARHYVEEHHRWETCLEPLMKKVFA